MTAQVKPIIGVLGGMGPEATVELMRRVIKATPAQDDCDHVHLLVDSNPDVPSRIAALIEGTGKSPEPELVRMAERLERAGATALAIACNTAHAYGTDIRAAVSVPLLDMIDLTAESVDKLVLTHRRVGLLASSAVISLGLYEKALGRSGIELAVPGRQSELMDVIKSVKAGDTGRRVRSTFAGLAADLAGSDVDMLLIACTELSVIADSLDEDTPCIDALDVLARAIVCFGLAPVTHATSAAAKDGASRRRGP